MLTKRVIPCLDVTSGRVVKGVNLIESCDAGDPVEIARRYDEQGADEIAFLDITAMFDGRDLMLGITEAVASQVFIPLTAGGGVRVLEDMRRLLSVDTDKINMNSSVVANPQLVSDVNTRHGAQCIIAAIDAKKTPTGGGVPRWEVFTHGGHKSTGLDAVVWACKMTQCGAGEILLTSMDRGGTKAGFDLELMRAMSDAMPVPAVASSGVSNLQHLTGGVQRGHVDAVLAASIFHYDEYTAGQAKQFIAEQTIPVRIES